ncbi:somatostatin [Kryptolebias marmoratus]|uniref:Somatostatin-like n=1 Tax=Kryptolebias marmoratus TaxID=37003 RepID=A0A3Q3BD11_KRYMA|nr:somatostatin [Kryptolebias marmoratus]
MFHSQVQVLLAVACLSGLLARVGGAPRREQLTEILQEDFISGMDLSHLLVLRFASELMASRGKEAIREEEEEEEELGGGRERLMRRHAQFAHRARKPGCRNFFWKSFTAC